jgi:hypothetical protein
MICVLNTRALSVFFLDCLKPGSFTAAHPYYSMSLTDLTLPSPMYLSLYIIKYLRYNTCSDWSNICNMSVYNQRTELL